MKPSSSSRRVFVRNFHRRIQRHIQTRRSAKSKIDNMIFEQKRRTDEELCPARKPRKPWVFLGTAAWDASRRRLGELRFRRPPKVNREPPWRLRKALSNQTLAAVRPASRAVVRKALSNQTLAAVRPASRAVVVVKRPVYFVFTLRHTHTTSQWRVTRFASVTDGDCDCASCAQWRLRLAEGHCGRQTLWQT